ncbi:MAG TPA: hypothetical protein ENJ82_03530 [Bacteroidetes bacterium]|nr:hypothetical protein [Bacteroidota bacterium]
MKKRLLFYGSLLIFLWGCEPAPFFVGTWEYDQLATDKESPIKTVREKHRMKFTNNGRLCTDWGDRVGLGIWKYRAFSSAPRWQPHGDWDHLPPHLQRQLDAGRELHLLSSCLIYDGGKFQHSLLNYEECFYQLNENQLVLFESSSGKALVYSRLD